MMKRQSSSFPDLTTHSDRKLLAALKKYGFCDEHGHTLERCAEFVELQRRARARREVKQ